MNALPRVLPSDLTSRRLTWREFRERSKARFAVELRERFLLRFHFVAILAGTVLAGSLASSLAFDLGLQSMTWRYLLGLGVAYLSFLALVRLWIAYVEGWRPEPDLSDLLDCYDLASSPRRSLEAGGGRFGGGGAHGSWGDAGRESSSCEHDGAGWDLDLEDGLLLLLFVVLGVAVIGGLVYLIAIGPGILTEAAFEVILAGSLTRRSTRGLHGRWLKEVVSSTALPLIVVVVLTAAFASFAQELCPAAIRLGDVVECIGR